MKTAKLVRFAKFEKDEQGKVKKIIPGEFQVDDDPVPEIEDNEVLLKTLKLGVCGSDIQIYHGLHMAVTPDKLPRIMGHEVAAQVVALGKNVKDYKVGDKVTVEPQIYCGHCFPCMNGRFNVCEHLKVMGVHCDGFASEFYACDSKYLHPVPQNMDENLIALVEPLAVGVGACNRATRLKGGNVVVVGAGTIGNCIAQAAIGLGAGKVMVTDIVDDKLEYVKECGADFTYNTSKITLKDAVEEAFGVQKADVIIDAVANPYVFQTILDATRPSSEVIMTGNYKAPVTLDVPRIQRREVNLIGHMMYVRQDFQDAIQLLAEGKINTRKLISQHFDFYDYGKAFQFADEHPADYMKMIIDFDKL